MIALRKFLAFILKFLYPAKIVGKENIPEGGAMIVCNHFRMIDPLYILISYKKNDIYFLSKKEATDSKFIGKILIKMGAVPVDREKPSLETMMKAIKILKEDHKLVLYPEGTRNKTGTTELQPIKAGAALFAIKSKKPIVPIMMSGKARFLRRTTVVIGKPVELTEFYDQKLTPEINEQLNDFIKNRMLEVQEEVKLLTKKKDKKNKSLKG